MNTRYMQRARKEIIKEIMDLNNLFPLSMPLKDALEKLSKIDLWVNLLFDVKYNLWVNNKHLTEAFWS